MKVSPRLVPDLRASGTGLLEPPVERRRPARPRRRDGSPPRGRGGDDGFGGGGDGGFGWNGDDGDNDPAPSGRPEHTAELAFVFVLIGISSLFLAFLFAYAMLSQRANEWPPPGAPRPPDGLWISTLLLIASSFALHTAGRGRAQGDPPEPLRARRRYVLTLLLGLAFLGAQAWLWRDLLHEGLTTDANAYGALFYSLTGLHALHVIAGLAFLAFVIGQRSPSGTTRRLCAMYWHFMGVLWLVLFSVLYFV